MRCRFDPDDDRRLGVLFRLEESWDAGDRMRFSAASTLIGHDDRGGPLLRQTMGLLVEIVDRLDSLISDIETGARHDEDEARGEALELRAGYERLGEIVHAVTAVPVLS